MKITKLFLLASAGLAALAFTPAAEAHEGHHHHHHQVAQSSEFDRPWYYKSNPEIIYVNPSNTSYRGASDWVVLIEGRRFYRNHRATN